MKDPHPLSHSWNKASNKEPVLISVASTNKKFKRKSREPKRLFSSPEPDRTKSYAADTSDLDSVEDPHAEPCHVSRLAPLQRHLMLSPEVSVAPVGAIDMRIGSAVPGITSKLTPLPTASFSSPEIGHWPTAISQPLTNRFKLAPRSAFTLSSGNSSLSPSSQVFPLTPPHSAPVSRASQISHCHDHLEPQEHSPKESPRKRGVTDGQGRVPEVKAIQQTRRLLANARERTRVHTISAAFEALRKQVPCYSYGQKLSKLAILRIACNYILSLAQLAELDYSSDRSSVTFSQCVEQCTRTLQAEGRSKKRKVGRMSEDL
ncbi:transcription factor atoh8 [Synchiropus picturatus]